ncbi:hypothetical protein [Pedobacter sp. MW01-1-1]|uniref:hypothetical protein n=1 Tax=Pedobacter sp. MW01-1-1 TaxID=3383027 RepID=UPI003FF03C06
MTDLQLFSNISALPSNLKQEVADFVAVLQQKSKGKHLFSQTAYTAEEPLTHYNSNFSDFLLKGPVFSDDQIAAIKENRKKINQWRTK